MFAKYGETLEMKALMESENPVGVQEMDPEGFTTLLWACRNGHVKMTEYLMSVGADKETGCSHGLRALHHACNNNREAVARVLLDEKADPNAADGAGNTAVHYAASRGILNLLNQVVEGGGDLTVQNKAGQTALHKVGVGGDLSVWFMCNSSSAAVSLLFQHVFYHIFYHESSRNGSSFISPLHLLADRLTTL